MFDDHRFKEKYVKTSIKTFESVIKESILVYLILVLPYFTYKTYDYFDLFTWDGFIHWLKVVPIVGIAFCSVYTGVRTKIKLYFTLRKQVMSD